MIRTRTAVAREVADGVLNLVTMAGAPPLRRSLVAMRRRDAGPPVGVVAAFLDILKQSA